MKLYLLTLCAGLALVGCGPDQKPVTADPSEPVAVNETEDGGDVTVDVEKQAAEEPEESAEPEEQAVPEPEPKSSAEKPADDSNPSGKPSKSSTAKSATTPSKSESAPYVGVWVLDYEPMIAMLKEAFNESGQPPEQIEGMIKAIKASKFEVNIKPDGSYSLDLNMMGTKYNGTGTYETSGDSITLSSPKPPPPGSTGEDEPMTLKLDRTKDRLHLPEEPGAPPLSLKRKK